MILKATTVVFCQHLRKHEGRSHTCHQQRSFARSTRAGCWGTPQPALVRHFTYKWMNERAALGVSYSCGLFKALRRFKAKTTPKTLTPHSNQMLILSGQKWHLLYALGTLIQRRKKAGACGYGFFLCFGQWQPKMAILSHPALLWLIYFMFSSDSYPDTSICITLVMGWDCNSVDRTLA